MGKCLRISHPAVLGILFICTLSCYWTYWNWERPSNNLRDYERVKHERPSNNLREFEGVKQKIVILMTQCRSGSSFTGEIFSATKGTMYLYEPLLPFGMDCRTLQDRKLSLLSRILNCNFDNLQLDYAAGFHETRFPDYGDCVPKGYCFPYASVGLLKGYAAICHRMLNETGPSVAFNPKSKHCGFPLKEHILNEQCLNSKIIFTKVTRVCSLNQIQKVYNSLTSNGKDVYVIHLVRDPRSSIHSRIRQWQEDPVNTTRVVCERIRENLNIVKEIKSRKESAPFSSLVTAERYLRVRFEDLSLDAIGWAEKIFRFIGRTLPPEVEQNIQNHLQQNEAKLKRQLADKNNAVEAKEILNRMKLSYTAIRDSREVLRKWRKTITWKLVAEVQNECADIMSSLGYIPFSDEKVLRNISIPFFMHLM